MAVPVEIIRRNAENVIRLVTRDGQDGNLRVRDQNVTPEPAGLKTS